MYGTEGFSSLHNSRQEARVCCFKSLWSRSVSEQQEVPPPPPPLKTAARRPEENSHAVERVVWKLFGHCYLILLLILYMICIIEV